jgi:hypothetical protein
MKVKVYVIDFEVPPRVKKWALRIGTPLVALFVGGVSFAGLPGGYADGQPLTKAELDANFNYVQSEIATMPIVTAWSAPAALTLVTQSTTPNPLDSQTTQASWRRVGDTMEVFITTVFTAQPSGSGAMLWTLPNGASYDATKLPGATPRGNDFGSAYSATSNAFLACEPYFGSPTQAVIQCGTVSPAGPPSGIQAGSGIELHLSFPVQGWGVSQ